MLKQNIKVHKVVVILEISMQFERLKSTVWMPLC